MQLHRLRREIYYPEAQVTADAVLHLELAALKSRPDAQAKTWPVKQDQVIE
jgi:hypothetical protein